MIKRVVVFRFDHGPLICRKKIALIRELNPGVAICGLYGGPGGYRRLAFRTLGQRVMQLDHLYISPRSPSWNWKNGDLALAAWYKAVGQHLEFDVVHFIEWDLQLLAPLPRLYAHVPANAVGLTCLTPLREVAATWPWMQEPGRLAEWTRLLAQARAVWGFDGEPVACVAGGACFPRAFLDRYAEETPPELCHDELRLPLFAQAFGFPLVDTGFRRGWQDKDEDRFFNLRGGEIDQHIIAHELTKPDGRRVFHPVRRPNAFTHSKWPGR
jgi:hypothetical protein